MNNNFTLHFDGSCNPNPGGVPAFGWTIADESGEVIAEKAGQAGDRGGLLPIGWRTNNVAEWLGLIDAVKWLQAWGQPIDRLEIRGDSNLVINVAANRWKSKKPHLTELRDQFRKIVAAMDVGHIEMVWVPREQNGVADELSKAINEATA